MIVFFIAALKIAGFKNSPRIDPAFAVYCQNYPDESEFTLVMLAIHSPASFISIKLFIDGRPWR